jgi:hypothetical protein
MSSMCVSAGATWRGSQEMVVVVVGGGGGGQGGAKGPGGGGGPLGSPDGGQVHQLTATHCAHVKKKPMVNGDLQHHVCSHATYLTEAA